MSALSLTMLRGHGVRVDVEFADTRISNFVNKCFREKQKDYETAWAQIKCF